MRHPMRYTASAKGEKGKRRRGEKEERLSSPFRLFPSSPFPPLSSELHQSEFFHATAEGRDGEAEDFGGAAFAADDAARLPQHLFDVGALGLREREEFGGRGRGGGGRVRAVARGGAGRLQLGERGA